MEKLQRNQTAIIDELRNDCLRLSAGDGLTVNDGMMDGEKHDSEEKPKSGKQGKRKVEKSN